MYRYAVAPSSVSATGRIYCRRVEISAVRASRGYKPRYVSYNDRRARGLVIWRPCTVYTWRGCPRVGSARVPICRDVVYVRISTRVVRAVVRSYYACTVTHTCSVRMCAVVSNYGASMLIVYSTGHALSRRYCTGTGVQGVPLRGEDLTPIPNSKLRQARPVLLAPIYDRSVVHYGHVERAVGRATRVWTRKGIRETTP